MSKKPIYQVIRRRSHRQATRRVEPVSRLGGWGIAVLAVLVSTILLLIVIGGLLFAFRTDQYPDVDTLHTYFDPQNGWLLTPTQFYDRAGDQRLYTLAPPGAIREFLSYEEFSPDLLKITTAVDDAEYWSSMGFDENSIPAMLVERTLISGETSDDLMRYWLVASLLFSEGKEQTLAWYLNSSHYGMNTVGAGQAAQLYFGKSAAELSLAESALLVAVHQSPALNPFSASAAALDNKDLLLASLLEQGVISDDEYQQAAAEEIHFQPFIEAEQPSTVIQMAIDALNEDIPYERLLLGGYKVMTTLDADLQAQTECVLAEQLLRMNQLDHIIDTELLETCSAARFLTVLPPDSAASHFEAAGSAILLEPRTGQILALVEQDDLVSSGVSIPQQPGTSLAPFVALAGFRQGESPATLRWDIPADDPDELLPFLTSDQVYDGPMRSREAVVRQDALVLAEWMSGLGEDEVIRFSQAVGIHSLQAITASSQLLFTGGDLPLTEQAAAYAVFANLGVQHGVVNAETLQMVPQLILAVQSPEGNQLPLNSTMSQARTLVGSDLAYLVHDVLSDEVLRRSEYGYPNPLSIGRPVGGLLSSSDADQQHWALGYTPQLVAGVWMGTESGSALPLQSAGNVWHALMAYALEDEPVESWNMPTNIVTMTVCSPSGLLPTTACQQLVNETFIEGNQPLQLDNLYQSFAINRETGRLATVFTPLALIDERIFLVVPSEAQDWAEENGLPVPPVDYDTIQQVQDAPNVYFTTPENFSYVSGEVEITGTAAGEDFESYYLQVGEGLNPDQWIVIQEEQFQPVHQQVLGTWDTVGFEGLYAVRLVVEREGQQVESALLQVTVDNTPPEMTVIVPQPEQTLTANAEGEVVLQVHPEDNLGVAEVRWFVDGELLAARQQSPYTVFLALNSGEHVLEIEVLDQAGNSTISAELIFYVAD